MNKKQVDKQIDLLGDEVQVGDYIVCSRTHDESHLSGFKVIGITPKGYLKLTGGQYGWDRTQLQDSRFSCLRITKEQYEALAKKHKYEQKVRE